jgi:hypothetical protein
MKLQHIECNQAILAHTGRFCYPPVRREGKNYGEGGSCDETAKIAAAVERKTINALLLLEALEAKLEDRKGLLRGK